MAYFAPHLHSTFEGWYTKFRLPSGSSIALIVSSVPAVSHMPDKRPYMISFTYVAADGEGWWQREYWPSEWRVYRDKEARQRASAVDQENNESSKRREEGSFAADGDSNDFLIQWGYGELGCTQHGAHVWWRLYTTDIDFSADQTNRGTPWRPGDVHSTPAGLLAHLPLPVQWHVHTVDALANYVLDIKEVPVGRGTSPPGPLESRVERGVARAHVEKNWAHSFPRAYTWIQARDHLCSSGLSIAGGELVRGAQAYLVGYQGVNCPNDMVQPLEQEFINFTPPTAMSIFSASLGLQSDVDCKRGTIDLVFTGMTRRLRVHAKADPRTYFPLAAPLNTGHAVGYTVQSFAAKVEVGIDVRGGRRLKKQCERRGSGWGWGWTEWVRRLWEWGKVVMSLTEPWVEVEKQTFENASIEFGGAFYTPHEE